MTSKRQKFYVQGGIDEFTADGFAPQTQKPFRFLKLVNAAYNIRDGGVYTRNGSLTETISGTLNRPLGMATYKADTASALMPVNVKYLANFAGANWRKKDAGSWSSVSTNANCSFDTSHQTQFAQIGTLLAIAGGRPARWHDGATEIERVGYPAPSSAITFSTAAGGLSPQYGYKWMFTYYNSTTGKESDWSPISADSGAQTSKQFNLTITTASPNSSADKKRIYRTLDGGDTYYFVTDIAIATGSYSDNTADASLGVEAPTQYDNGLPPATSFLITAFNSRLLWVDASNPATVYVSKPYIGNTKDLEYYPAANRLNFDHEVTGWVNTLAGLLVFGVSKISILTGSDFSTYQIQPFRDGDGTLFGNSIKQQGGITVWLGQEGYKALQNGKIETISDDVSLNLNSILGLNFDNYIYASTDYNPAEGQFIFSLSASSTSGTPWVMSSSGIYEEWQLSSSGATEGWQIPGATSTDNTNRVFVAGWDPTTGHWTNYEFPQAPDYGSTAKAITFVKTPLPSSETFDPQPDVTFLGIDGGTNAGIIVGGWRNDRSTDDGANISAEAITTRITPGTPDGSYKRFRHLQMEGAYSDVASLTGGTLQYIMDQNDPHVNSYTAQDFALPTKDMKVFKTGKGRFCHLRAAYSGSLPKVLLMRDFVIHYNEIQNRESR